MNMHEIIGHESVVYLINKGDKIAEVIGYNKIQENIIIPRSINYKSTEYVVKSILSAFENSNINTVIFASDSEVQTIEKKAYYRSSFRNIKIPSKVKKIGESCFSYCKQLKSVEFSDDSQLQTIEKEAFYRSTITSIKIPSGVTFIGEESFHLCEQLQSVEFSNNSKLQVIDVKAFTDSAITRIKIPSEVTRIKDLAFFSCKKTSTS